VLSNLSKGNYTLQIRKKMPEGNYLTNQLTFKILPQWYETIVFYIAIILLSTGLFIFSLKAYANSIIHKNIKLEEAIAKRTGELEIANDKLVKEIDLKNKIVGIISHDMITPLSYMNIVTSELIATKPTVSKEKLEKNIEILNQSASGILLTANNTLNLLNINKNNIQINIRRLNLHELVQEKLNIYSIVAQKKEIELNNGIEKKLYIYSDITLLGLVIQNIINNSVKYTMKGAVNIYSQTTNGLTKLFIEDSGLGMSSQMLETIKMQSEILSSNEDIYTNNQKMGWNIIVDILRLLNIHYEIESKENEGTVVTLHLK
jgi:signal transduction histidine kinase